MSQALRDFDEGSMGPMRDESLPTDNSPQPADNVDAPTTHKPARHYLDPRPPKSPPASPTAEIVPPDEIARILLKLQEHLEVTQEERLLLGREAKKQAKCLATAIPGPGRGDFVAGSLELILDPELRLENHSQGVGCIREVLKQKWIEHLRYERTRDEIGLSQGSRDL